MSPASSTNANSAFMATMSPEFRTPLNQIICFTVLVMDKYFGDLNPKLLDDLADVLNSSDHLLSLINDILDLSKVEAGKMELQLEQIELPDGVRDLPGLTSWLQSRSESWATALADTRLHVAVNQEIVKPDASIADGDEVAWFPPVTGG